ncbi:MAG: 50S ribosomal protein L15 [Deltaproteobacteria bacterium]|nr:MAG: 50S ribosomal protein L15 [Deltaproteobacteria bacterium]
MNLGSLIAPKGARKKRKRLGRGEGSGHGGTSTKGHKGQKARAGGYHKRGFEGGQMPLSRRLPKFGFTNPFRREYTVINIGDLESIPGSTIVDETYLKQNGFIKKLNSGVKVLGNGDVKVPLTIKVTKISETAKKKIEAAGGKVEVSTAAQA